MAYLRDIRTNQIYSLSPASRFTVGRSPKADLPIRDETCSREQFVIEVDAADQCTLHPLSRVCPTLCAGVALSSPIPLDKDVLISAGQARFEFLIERPQRDAAVIDDNSPEVATVVGRISQFAELPGDFSVFVQDEMILGRDPRKASVVLPHVQVSRLHASLKVENGRYYLKDLGSSCGTFVNGQPVHGTIEVADGSVIGIGPYVIHLSDGWLCGQSRKLNHRLVARNLVKRVVERGSSKTILDEVSLGVQPREFICILGPAGCGKSTLLKALAARESVDEGTVSLNDIDVVANYEQLKRDLVLVPQKDVLPTALTVEQSLRFTAKLRLPADTIAAEMNAHIERTIECVGLSKQRHTRISKLSGGQTKRVSLATELLSDPNIILLDEVTSGLDLQSDGDAMRLFRTLTQHGKSVVCVTHNLSHIEETCHLIVVLAEGGRLAFMGTPRQALEFFHVSEIGKIYSRLQEQTTDHWQQVFRAHPQYQTMIAARVSAMPPTERSTSRPAQQVWQTWWQPVRQQLPVLLNRYIRILCSDVRTLIGAVGQALLIAMLLVLVFGDVTATKTAGGAANLYTQTNSSALLLFLSVTTCYWFGCNNASKEIVKERPLYEKEYHAGLLPWAYYGSKVITLSAFSMLQAIVMFSIVYGCCRLPNTFSTASVIVALSACVGVVMGLTISSLVKTEELATLLVPVVLIPQIILSSGLKPLQGLAELLAECFVSSYWTYGLIRGTFSPNFQTYLASSPNSLSASMAMLLLQVTVCIAITVWRLSSIRPRA